MTNSDKKQPLRELLKTSLSYAPTEVDLEKGCEVLDFLSKALLGEDYRTTTSSAFPSLKLHYSTNRSITLGIIPLDFYAWKLWRPDEPIACCVAGSISRTTFHAVARGKFRLLSDAITIEQGDKSEGTFNLQISSIKIQLRYHPNPLICRWSGVNNTGVAEVKSEMPWQSQERLSELERTQEIADQLSFYGADIVSKSYFIYQRWAKNLGFYPFTLTREHILAMAAYGLYASLTPHQMITLDIPFPDESYTLSETGNDLGLQVSKIKEPAWKMMFAFVELSRHLLREDASVMLDFSVLQWPVFFHLWSNFIRIDISYWGSSRVTVSKYLQAVETTIRLSTLKDLRKIEHEMVFHLWPHPFQAQKETPWMDEADSTERFNKKYLHLLKTAIERNPYIETEAEARESPNLELTYFIGYDNGTGLMEEMPSTMAFLSKAFKDALDSEDTSCSFSQLSNVTGPDLAPIYVPFM